MDEDWDSFRVRFSSSFFRLELEKCANDLDRMSAVLDTSFESITSFELRDRKSHKDSSSFTRWKAKGNSFLERYEYYNAVVSYTRALYFASTDSEKAIAFGNRSAALLSLRLPKESLVDIEASLAHEYPLSKRFRLANRAGECYLMLQNIHEAKLKFHESQSLLKSGQCDLSEKQKETWSNRITQHLKQSDSESSLSKKSLDAPRTFECVRPQLPKVASEVNSNITSGSTAIEIKTSDVDGRGLYATRDIKVGEYLAVELPYASCVIPERYVSHCYRCTKRSIVLVPCRGCSVVGYCDSECESIAWCSYHKFECPVIDQLDVLPNLRMVRLAYRAVISTDKQEILRVVSQFSKTSSKGCDCSHDQFEIFESSDYACAYSIIANSNKRDRNDMTERTLLAVYLLLCAIKSNYISNSPVDRMEIALIGSAFLRHLQSLPCNAHEINEEFVPCDGNLTGAELQEIASGLFPLLSLVNHSCDPNIHRVCFSNGACSLIAVRPIYAGEQIYDCYSQHFAVAARDQRQAALREQYLFDCCCEACVNDWPRYEALCEVVYPALKIVGLNSEDSRLWKNASKKRDKFMDLLAQGRQRFTEDNAAETFFTEYQMILGKIIKRPWKEMNNNEECLKILWNLKGNLFQDFI